MLTQPTPEIMEAFKNRHVTMPPHVDQGGGGTEHGIPAGGTAGQWLRKKSNTDYDVEWQTMDYPPSEVRVMDFFIDSGDRGDNPYIGSASLTVSADNINEIPVDAFTFKNSVLLNFLVHENLSDAQLISFVDNSGYPDLKITSVVIDNVWMPSGDTQIKYRAKKVFEVYYPADPDNIDPSSDTKIGETELYFDWKYSNSMNDQTSDETMSLYDLYICMPKGSFNFNLDEYEIWNSLTPEQKATCYIQVVTYLQGKIADGYFPENTTGNNPSVSVSGSLAYWDEEMTKDNAFMSILYVEPNHMD